jgi:hypothetical protein
MLRIHDLKTGFENLNVAGIAYYADRALILPGTALVQDGAIDGHLEYLADVGIGANAVIRAGTGDIVRDMADDGPAREAILSRVAAGDKIQFFCSTPHEERLLARLGLGWESTFSAPVGVTREANDKASLRRLGLALGRADAFPPHRVVRPADGPGATYAAVGWLMNDVPCDFVVLKRPDLASGDGMKLVERTREWLPYVDAYLAQHSLAPEIIVEAGFEHVPMSIQWEVHDDGPRYACVTAQLIDETFGHLGNVIANGELPDVDARDAATMRRMSDPFVRHYWERGFRGVCGFDFLRAKNTGETFMLECNGRVTATTYALGLARQVAARVPSWAVMMTNVSAPSSVRSFEDIRRGLGRRLFDGRKGALPFNVRCLQLDEPKFAVCAVGRDVLEASIILHDVKSDLAK